MADDGSEVWKNGTWQKPTSTIGKGFGVWEDLKVNSFFSLQRHRMEGSSISGVVKVARRIFTSHLCLCRIVINTFPFPLIAESDNSAKVRATATTSTLTTIKHKVNKARLT